MFPYEEFTVNENKIVTDLHFPGAAFVVISCRAEAQAAKKE